MLSSPVALEFNASKPKAKFFCPLVSAAPALVPIATVPSASAELIAVPASIPIKTVLLVVLIASPAFLPMSVF